MRICYNLPHVFNGQSTDLQNAYALKALLDCLINLNIGYLRLNKNSIPRLYQSGVRYGRTKVWEPIPALYARGFGDCKSLTAALVAEYAVRGIKSRPVFRFIDNRSPRWLANDDAEYHILVQVPGKNGLDHSLWEDPSRKLGMGASEIQRFTRGTG